MTTIHIKDSDLAPLASKIIIITGGSSGIGLAATKLFSSYGAKVVVGDLDPCPFDSPAVSFQRTDVTDWKSQVSLFKKAIEVHGRVDHIWANAGTARLDQYCVDQYDESGELLPPDFKTLDVNLKGAILTCKLGIHHLKKQDATGSILITASAAGFIPFFLPEYGISKHAAVGLMRCLSSMLVETRIRVNCLTPVFTETNLAGIDHKVMREKLNIRMQSAEAVARSAGWLMSGDTRTGMAVFSARGLYKELDSTFLSVTSDTMDLGPEDGLVDPAETARVITQLVAEHPSNAAKHS